MKRVLLKIAFDGTAYHGWQVQPNAITVQEVLQNAVSDVLGTKIGVTGCSRTDAGVSAREFFCHLDCNDNIPDDAFLRGVNGVLPNDISVLDVKEVAADFHARYNAKGKNYIYSFYFGIKDPFLDRYALNISENPDLNRMNDFCKTVVGTHDFYGFSSSGRSVEDTVRTVTLCEAFYDENRNLKFSVTADGFLYNMVRILAGTCLFVGTGKLDTDIALRMFNEKDRSLGGNTLAAKGLMLNKVFY